MRADIAETRRQRLYHLSFDALILHCPGPQRVPDNPFHTQWLAACETFFADEDMRGSLHDAPALTIVTYNTSPQECLLERCLHHLGLRAPVVLGRAIRRWQWIHKIALVLTYLDSGACSTEYLLCLDGDDTLVLAAPSDILRRFHALECRIAFCNTRGDQPADQACWDFENSVPEYSDPLHRHLNAGGYIGETRYIRECLAEIMAAATAEAPWVRSAWGFDDQLAWRHLHRRYYPQIKVDAGCRIFLRFDEDR